MHVLTVVVLISPVTGWNKLVWMLLFCRDVFIEAFLSCSAASTLAGQLKLSKQCLQSGSQGFCHLHDNLNEILMSAKLTSQ